MTLVVDASVAAKWVLPQEHSSPANAVRDEEGLIAPALISAEIASAIWKAVRRGTVLPAEAVAALKAGLAPFEALVADEILCARALALAIQLRHPPYDCFYLALAERENAPLVTADEAMIAVARKAKIKVQRI